MRVFSILVLITCLLPVSGLAATKNKAAPARSRQVKARPQAKGRVQARTQPRVQGQSQSRVQPRSRVQPQAPRVAVRGLASTTGVSESDKPLKVQGQARNISMLLVLKGDKDQINFVKPRTSFQDKIGETRF